MTPLWAVCLPASGAGVVAPLRREPHIECLESEEAVWLRGAESDERLERLLRQLPGARRFAVLPDGQLLPAGSRLPCGWLPRGVWQALDLTVRPELPLAILGARRVPRIPLELVRSYRSADPRLLQTTLASWQHWGDEAPQVRLERLHFALSGDGRALIRGDPLPPLPGERYYESARLCLPCGWILAAQGTLIDPAVISESLELDEGELALFLPGGTWERIGAEQFVRATRSAIRLSPNKEVP